MTLTIQNNNNLISTLQNTNPITLGITSSFDISASAAASAIAAANSAAQAALYDGKRFNTVAALLADTFQTYANTTVGEYFNTRKEGFAYRVASSGVTDHHVITAGGVKLYVVTAQGGGLDPRALGALANGTANDAPFVEKAFTISKSVSLADSLDVTYRLASVIGLPDQTLYAAQMMQLVGFGAKVVLDGVAAGDDIFTSAAAKLAPASTLDLYTGKFNVIGINFTQSSASVLINGDRLYNVIVQHNSFSNVTSIVRSFRAKGPHTQGYMQSITISDNQLSGMTKIVDAKKAFNFRYIDNHSEAQTAGIYIDGPDSPAILNSEIRGGQMEGGGLPIKLGMALGCSIRNLYLEINVGGDSATEKCDILVGVGGGRSQGLVIDGVTFVPSAGQIADANYYGIKDAAAPGITGYPCVQNCVMVTGTRLFQPGKVRDGGNNTVGNNTAAARRDTRGPQRPGEAGLDYRIDRGNRTIAALNSAGVFKVAAVSVADIKAVFTAPNYGRQCAGNLIATLRFRTAGGIVTGSAVFSFLYQGMGAAGGVGLTPVNDVYMSFVLQGFTQTAAGQSIETTFGATTQAHFGATPVLSVTRTGDIYNLSMNSFTAGTSLPNYGPATNVDIAVTLQSFGANAEVLEWTSVLNPVVPT